MTTTQPQHESVIAKHIESKPNVCGGKPCVAGTRIRVWDIHVWYDLESMSPEEIVSDYPQLTVASVHAALAYFFDNRDAIEQEMSEANEFVARLEMEQGPTRYTKLRDKLLREKDIDGSDSVPSG